MFRRHQHLFLLPLCHRRRLHHVDNDYLPNIFTVYRMLMFLDSRSIRSSNLCFSSRDICCLHAGWLCNRWDHPEHRCWGGGKHNCWVETILVALHLEVQYCAVQPCFDASIFSGCSLLAAKVSVGVVLLSSDLVVLKLMVQVLDGVVVGIVVLPDLGTNMRCTRGLITSFCLSQKVPPNRQAVCCTWH